MTNKTKTRTANSTYPKVAIQRLNQALCFYQSLCLVDDSELLRNRYLRVAANCLAAMCKDKHNMKIFAYLIITLLISGCDNTSKKMTTEEYFETGKFIWKTYVPKSGQAETIQGELLRAIEKLRDEAQRNGNGNFNENCHGILIGFIRKHLNDQKIFDTKTIEQINRDLNTISVADKPYLGDDVYDKLTNRIIDWYLKNKTPIPHLKNPILNC